MPVWGAVYIIALLAKPGLDQTAVDWHSFSKMQTGPNPFVRWIWPLGHRLPNLLYAEHMV